MVRKNKEEVQVEIEAGAQKIQWVNRGGTLRFRKNQIIKPGERFSAFPEEIPQAFRDVIIPLGDLPAQVSSVKIKAEPLVYTLHPTEDNGETFDILDSKGKKINELPLDKETAESLIKDLQS
jgi:hypothetical protein